jgi:hypothetical protein
MEAVYKTTAVRGGLQVEKKMFTNLIYEVLTSVNKRLIVCWNVTTCSLVNRYHNSTKKAEVLGSFEALVTNLPTYTASNPRRM